MLDYRLETFLDLCETMNYTKTAEHLFITQPGVTGHIRFLEQFYGVKLFHYAGKTLSLTEEGEMLRRYAITVRADSLRMKQRIQGNHKTGGKLRLGATKTIGSYCMGEIVSDYFSISPNSNLSVYVDNTRALLKLLEKGKIDFALIEGFFESSKYASWPVAEADFIGVCGSGYVLAGKEVCFIDLLPCRLLLREEGSGTREIAEGILKEHNLTPEDFRLRFESGSFALICDLLEKNEGISFVYRNVAAKQMQAGTIVPLRIQGFNTRRPFHLVALKNRVFEDEIINFYEFIKDKNYFNM